MARFNWTPESDAIMREYHALGKSQTETAEAIGDGCTQTEVSREMKRCGLLARSHKFAAANDETRERLALARAQLAEAILTDAINLRERIWDEYTYYERGPDGPELVTLDVPDAKAVSDFTNAVAKMIWTLDNLTRMGAGRNTEQAKSMLIQMQEALLKAVEAEDGAPE